MSDLKVKVKLLNESAKVPERAHESDTGFDVTFTGIKKIDGDVIFFSTGIAVQPPEGYYFDLYPRSSISKTPLQLANSIGVIDEHYRGEVLVPLRVMHSQQGDGVGKENFPGGLVTFGTSKLSSIHEVARYVLAKHPKLVQLVLKQRLDCEFEAVGELEETVRSDGGFGSTNKKSYENKAVALRAMARASKSVMTDKDSKKYFEEKEKALTAAIETEDEEVIKKSLKDLSAKSKK